MSSAFGSTEDTGGVLMGREVAHLPSHLPQIRRGARRRITTYGEDILHQKCADVTEFGTPELKKLVDDMFATMAVAAGVGLAAPQVDVGLRIFVFDCPDDDEVRHVGHVINPVIDEAMAADCELEADTEGCLSIPGTHAEVTRPSLATVHGFDYKGNAVSFFANGLLARCFQHETDHTNGILFIDHISDAERARSLAEMEQMKEKVWEQWDVNAARIGKAHSSELS